MVIYNFSAGPAVLPEEVLKQAQAQLLDYKDTGMSVMEMSHRSSTFESILSAAEQNLRELMSIPKNYKILFLQGGASTQFSAVPMNLAQGKKAYYLDSGLFGKKAYDEAVKLSKYLELEPILLASSREANYSHLAQFDSRQIDPDAAYVHLTLNNTIEGTAIYELPETNGVLLVGDMSSNILAVNYDIERFGLIYAGAQKNIGPSGLTLVIVREDLLADFDMPSSMLDYRILAENNSLYNTPPTFSIYMAGLVFDWVKSLGGVSQMEQDNREKSALLYDYIDQSNFYQNPVLDKNERSLCNVVFTSPSKEIDAMFIAQAESEGFINLKGHRSKGGMRASIYNAFPKQGVADLIKFMEKFKKENEE